MSAVDNPFEHAHVFAESGPDESTVRVFAEPVHMEYRRGFSQPALHFKPMTQVVAHVVPAKREHGHGVAAHFTRGSRRGGRSFRAHGCSDVNAGTPVEGLIYQRHGSCPPAAEYNGAQR